MNIRQFNQGGIDAFSAFLAECREKPDTPVPHHLLEDDAHSDVVEPHINVEPRTFETRKDAAEYFHDLLTPLPESRILSDKGLWTWLTLFFFDEACPLQAGKRSVKKDYYYIYRAGDARYFYRHLLFIGWRILQVAPAHNRLLLKSPVSNLDRVTEVIMRSLYMTRIPCIFEVLDRLYWDENRGRARAGIVTGDNAKPGDLVRRLPIRIRQLEKTYDLFSLNADQMMELLGDEFQFNGSA